MGHRLNHHCVISFDDSDLTDIYLHENLEIATKKKKKNLCSHYLILNVIPYRKICFGDPKLQKSRGKCPKSSPQKLEIRPGSPYHRELRSKETPEKAGPVRLGQERDSLLTCKEEPELCPLMEQLPFMCTTEMYLCCWHQPPLSPLRETSPKKEEDVASKWTHYIRPFLFYEYRYLSYWLGHYLWIYNVNCVFFFLVPSWRENCIEPLDVDNPNSIPEVRHKINQAVTWLPYLPQYHTLRSYPL